MTPVLAIALKDLKQLLRDRVGAFFVFVFPALLGIFFGLIFSGGGGGPSGLGVVLVDQDDSPDSRALVESLRRGDTLDITTLDDWDQALAAVRKGERSAAVRVAPGFGDDLFGFSPDNRATIDLAIDPSKSFQRGVIEGVVTQAAFQRLTSSFTDPAGARRLLDRGRQSIADAEGLSTIERLAFTRFFSGLESLVDNVIAEPDPDPNPTAGDAAESPPTSDEPAANDDDRDEAPAFNPIAITTTEVTTDNRNLPRNSFSWTFPQANAWALLGCVMGFTASLVLERSRGTMTRLRLAPISVAQLLGGKSLACVLTAVFVQCLLLTIAFVAFGVRPQSYPLLVLAIVVGAVGFTGIAMLLSVLGRTEQSAMGIAQAAMLILALAGGAGVPLFIMPEWIQTAASVSPFKWLILAHEGAIWRGYSLDDMLLPLAVLLALGVTCFALGAAIFTRQHTTA